MNDQLNAAQARPAEQVTSGPEAGQVRRVIFLLAASIGLMMTGYGLIIPVFARRVTELGAGVEALGFMTMAFAMAQFLLAPFMGSLADRFGRRPLILVALAGFVMANVAFLLARSTGMLTTIRLFEGAITAGLLPAAMSVVADTVPEKERAKWVGILMGSYSAGFIFGPAVGGFLYDHWGFAAPFAISAALGLVGLVSALVLVPETRPVSLEAQVKERRPNLVEGAGGLLASLPRPLYLLLTLLFLDFIGVFGFAFVEPRMVFYFYEALAYTTTQFGLVVGSYGLALVIGQMTLGRLSDRLGRRPVIALGFGLNILFYLSLGTITQFSLVLLGAVIAGLGGALLAPALSAFYIDITQQQHRSRVLGFKESAAALGGVLGPLLVAVVNRWTTPQEVFMIAAGLMVAAVALALLALPGRISQAGSPAAEVGSTPAAVGSTGK